MTIVLGIISSANSFARETKTLVHLLNIPQEFFFHQLHSPIFNENKSSDQNLYFDVDMTEEDNDDISSSEKKKCSFGNIDFNIDANFTFTLSSHFIKKIQPTTYSLSLPAFYFNSPIVLRL